MPMRNEKIKTKCIALCGLHITLILVSPSPNACTCELHVHSCDPVDPIVDLGDTISRG